MKIIGLYTSSNRNGNTARLVRAALEAAEQSGADTEEIYLNDYTIEYCRGCMSCMRTGSCIINDDFAVLKNKLYTAEGIILGSPTYGRRPAARLKNLIVDRLGMYSVYTAAFGGKYFAGISTGGAIGIPKVAKNLAKEFAVGFFKRGFVTGSYGCALGSGWPLSIEDYPEFIKKAQRLGERMVTDILHKRKYPMQFLFERMLLNIVAHTIIKKNIKINKDKNLKAVYNVLKEKRLINF